MNRPDYSEYVAHFTKSKPPCVRADDDSASLIRGDALGRLISILEVKRIVATPMPWNHRKAVAFTECPWCSMLDHAGEYSPYGVGFTKAHLFAAGGGPAIYLRPDLHERQRDFVHKENDRWEGIHPDLYAFVTPLVPAYAPKKLKDQYKDRFGEKPLDYSHEREWRVAHDFTFNLDQVQFVTVASYEDVAGFPRELKDQIGRDRFVIMDVYRQIERLWPTHLLGGE
jgi:hypothetical protein